MSQQGKPYRDYSQHLLFLGRKMSNPVVFMCNNASKPWFMIHCKQLTIRCVQLKSKLATFCVCPLKYHVFCKQDDQLCVYCYHCCQSFQTMGFDIPNRIELIVLKHLCILCTMGSNRLKTGHCLGFHPKVSCFGGEKMSKMIVLMHV